MITANGLAKHFSSSFRALGFVKSKTPSPGSTSLLYEPQECAITLDTMLLFGESEMHSIPERSKCEGKMNLCLGIDEIRLCLFFTFKFLLYFKFFYPASLLRIILQEFSRLYKDL